MDKVESLSKRVDELEREYRAILTKALTDYARGRWGLFGHNEHLYASGSPTELDELRALAQAINRARYRIAEGPFPLHDEFETARGRARANDPGEPKQAEAWLQRLAGI